MCCRYTDVGYFLVEVTMKVGSTKNRIRLNPTRGPSVRHRSIVAAWVMCRSELILFAQNASRFLRSRARWHVVRAGGL